jgi:hypothetical protein
MWKPILEIGSHVNGFSQQEGEIRSTISHRAPYRINCLINALRNAISFW